MTDVASVVRYGDRMALKAPAGLSSAAGERFLVARRGPVLDDLGRLIIPTGVVRVAEAPSAGSPASAEVVSQFAVLSCDDLLLPLELPSATNAGRPVPISDGAIGEVVWIAGSALLPSLQYAAIVNIGAAAGLKPGDQVVLLSPARADSAATIVATASVLRVGARTATVNIIHQSGAGVEIGMPVRVSAKLP